MRDQTYVNVTAFVIEDTLRHGAAQVATNQVPRAPVAATNDCALLRKPAPDRLVMVLRTGVKPFQTPLDTDTVAVVSGGNFRLLTQIQRIIEINAFEQVTKAVVGARWESFVIGR
jgi:hypothetical protein